MENDYSQNIESPDKHQAVVNKHKTNTMLRTKSDGQFANYDH
jgi:hypothetical protein